ncbi:PKD domain-containing protein [Catalinimonas alkaloidigena]|uniref:PKD domain-containing protein n=1 Tax=Catalinimonas alkaloidigena TaxID=1075417 RepID=UPI00159FA807|nr:PKD domain-containing protein [Catalinimonas alkaloidigena]
MLINWGDGTAPTPFSGTIASHTYTTEGIFTYTITGCSGITRGMIVNAVPPADIPDPVSITSPAGTIDNKRCVPEDLVFRIQPQDPDWRTNAFAQYEINWGDGTTQMVDIRSFRLDANGLGAVYVPEPIPHTYLPDQAGCSLMVNITYRNACGRNPSTPGRYAFGEYYFLDRDSAMVTPNPVILCDLNDVTLTATPLFNCLDSTNRYIRWEAIEDITPGCGPFSAFVPNPASPDPNIRDGFRPYDANRVITIPRSCFRDIVSADSTYMVRMTIRNQCGDDAVDVPIRVVAPYQPVFSAVDNTCPGAPMTFTNSTPDPYGVQTYEWNWGDGSAVQRSGSSSVNHTYTSGGEYWVKLTTLVQTSYGPQCSKIDSIRVRVRETVGPRVVIDPKEACGSLTTTLTNVSTFAAGASWTNWELGGNTNYNGTKTFLPSPGTYTSGSTGQRVIVTDPNPADSSVTIFYPDWGRYSARVQAQSGSCPPTWSDYERVYIYPVPKVNWKISDTVLCLGNYLTIRDSSRVDIRSYTNERGLGNDAHRIDWHLDFGDGSAAKTGKVYSSWNNADTADYYSPSKSNRITQYLFADTGTYWVKYRVWTEHCEAEDSIRIRVIDNAKPKIQVVQSGCSDALVTFVNQTDTVPNTVYEWIIRRGTTPWDTIRTTSYAPFDHLLPYYGVQATAQYRIRLRTITGTPASGYCYAETADKTIQVRPSPVARIDVRPNEGCGDTLVLGGSSFQNASQFMPANSTYKWTFGNGNSYVGGEFDPLPSQQYVNTSDSVRYFPVELEITTPAGCVFRASDQVRVNPSANLSVQVPDTVCAGQSVTLTAEGNLLRESSLVWIIRGASSTVVTGRKTVNYTFTNGGLFPVPVQIDLSGSNATSCSGTTTRQVIVLPSMNVNLTAQPFSACAGTPVAFAAQFTPGGPDSTMYGALTYTWNFGDGSPVVSNDQAVMYHAFENVTAAPVTRTVTVTVQGGYGCGTTVSTPVVVQPAVVAAFAPDQTEGCSPLRVNFTNLASGGTVSWWERVLPGGARVSLTPGPGGNLTRTFSNTDLNNALSYEIMQVVSNGSCADTLRDTITVYPYPQANFTYTSGASCSPVTIEFDPATSQGGRRYYWDFGDGTPVETRSSNVPVTHTFTNLVATPQNFTVTLRVENDAPWRCSDVETQVITVRPTVIAAFDMDQDVSCSPLAVQFGNRSSAAASRFLWERRQISPSLSPWEFLSTQANPNTTFESRSETDTTWYVIRLLAQDSDGICEAEAFDTVAVLPKPSVVFTASPAEECANVNLELDNTGTTGGTHFAYYRRFVHADSTWRLFHQATTTTSNVIEVFENYTLNTQFYDIKLVVTNGNICRDSLTRRITVKPYVQAGFTMDVTTGCTPLQVTLTNTSTTSAKAFYWDFGDGTTRSTGSRAPFIHTFSNFFSDRDTVYTVQLVAGDNTTGCFDTLRLPVRIYPQPRARIVANNPPSCSPATFEFDPSGSVGGDVIDWSIDGWTLTTTSRSKVTRPLRNTSNAPREVWAYLTVRTTSGCQSVDSVKVTIQPEVTASFTAPQDTTCTPRQVQFTNTSTGPYDQSSWQFMHPQEGLITSTAQHPLVTFNNTTDGFIAIPVRLVVSRSLSPQCPSEPYLDTIYVAPKPRARFVASDPGCGSTEVTFTYQDKAPGANGETYQWYIGTTLVATRTAANAGASYKYPFNNTTSGLQNYIVRLVTTNRWGCDREFRDTIQVQPQVTARFDSVPDGCGEYTVTFVNRSVNARNFVWDFDDNTTSTDRNPTHTFPGEGVYTVKLTAWYMSDSTDDVCVKEYTQVIRVAPKPKADPKATPVTCSPQTFTFSYGALQTAGVTRTWKLHNGERVTANDNASFTRSYVNTTAVPQVVREWLVVRSAAGCLDSAYVDITINPNVEAGFTYEADGCSPRNITFSNQSAVSANRFKWTILPGLGNPQVIQTNSAAPFTRPFQNDGDTTMRVKVWLEAWNADNDTCRSTFFEEVKIYPNPKADFTVGPIQCSPATVSFDYTNTHPENGEWYVWDFGDTTITVDSNDAKQQVFHTFVNDTDTVKTFTVTLTTQNRWSCPRVVTKTIKVQPVVTLAIEPVIDACEPYKVTFVNNSSKSARYFEWHFNDEDHGVSAQKSPSYTFRASRDTTYQVVVKAWHMVDINADSCVQVDTIPVRVLARPEVLVNEIPEDCSGSAFEFSYNQLTYVDSLVWVFHTGDTLRTRSTAPFKRVFHNDSIAPKTYTEYLYVRSAQGCWDTTSVTVKVKPYVRGGFMLSTRQGCGNLSVIFQDTSNLAATNREWRIENNGELTVRSDKFFQIPFTNESDVVRKIPVQLRVWNNWDFSQACATTVYDTITIYPQPKARFAPELPNCNASPYRVVLRYEEIVPGQEVYHWDFGDGTTLIDTLKDGRDSLVHTFTTTTEQVFEVRMRVVNTWGCTDSSRVPITVKPGALAAFQAIIENECAPAGVKFRNQSQNASYFRWDFGDGNTKSGSASEDFVHEYDVAGTYTVTLTAWYDNLTTGNSKLKSCPSTVTRTVVIHQKPIPFINVAETQGCNPFTVKFKNGTLMPEEPMMYIWEWGDNSSSDTTYALTDSLFHTFNNQTDLSRDYVVTLRAIGPTCDSVARQTIRVLPGAEAEISALNTVGCGPLTSTFMVQSPTPQVTYATYKWNSSDPTFPRVEFKIATSSNRQLTHTFRNDGTTVIRHWVSFSVEQAGVNSCNPPSDTIWVTVYPRPQATLKVTQPECQGNPAIVEFQRENLVNVDSVYYVIANPSGTLDTIRTEQDTIWTKSFENLGEKTQFYTIRMVSISEHGCEIVGPLQPFQIHPAFQAAMAPVAGGCSPLEFEVENLSTNPGGLYEWILEGSELAENIWTGKTSEKPKVKYEYYGPTDKTFEIILVAHSQTGCTDTTRQTVTVYGTPQPDFSLAPSPLQLPDRTITVQNLTEYQDQWHYTWIMGNGDTLDIDSATFAYTYANIDTNYTDSLFTVTLLARGKGAYACEQRISKTLVIRPVPPVAEFEAEAEGCAPVTAIFKNKSKWGHTYTWSFGDGSTVVTTSLEDIKHDYYIPGTYSVRLRVTGPGGETMAIKQDIITVYRMPRVTFETFPNPPEVRIPNEPLNFITYIDFEDPNEGYEFFWDFGDGLTSTQRNPEHFYQEEGEYVVSVTVKTKNGCSVTYVDSAGAKAIIGGEIVIPNAFSPNSGGPTRERVDLLYGQRDNDIFYPKVVGAREIYMQVYNRWGELIFESNELGYGWDGYYKGVLSKQDVYVYRIEVKFADGRRETFVGDVTLVR